MSYQLASSPAVTITPSGASLTYGELANQSARLVGALHSLGVHAGDRVAFLLGNQIEYPVALLGARRGGYDHLPLNVHADPDELRSLILQFKPAAMVVSDAYAELVEKLAASKETNTHWIMVGMPPSQEWHSYHDLLRHNAAYDDAPTPGKLLLLSGGSTGRSKIIERPNAGASDTPRRSVVLGHISHSNESVVLVSAPLYHTGPLGWLLGGLEVGAHVVVMERWNAYEQLAAVQRFGATIMPVVPTMMSRLLELPLEVRESFDLSSLRVVSHSAAPCSNELKKRFMAWLPQTWSGYSMSEGFGLTVISPEEWWRHQGSVGQSVPWCEVTIRDEDGKGLLPGEIGIVWFSRRDDARMCYLDNEEETKSSYNVLGEGTAFDLGYLDSDGYLYLTGRSKNMIIVGGVNIYPAAIEDVLGCHPAVTEACVVGVPHEDLGEVPCAVVQVIGEYDPHSLEGRLKNHCSAQLGRFATPNRVVFVEELPRTPTGKVRINDIRALVNT